MPAHTLQCTYSAVLQRYAHVWLHSSQPEALSTWPCLPAHPATLALPPTLPPARRYETTKAADAVSALKAALKPLATCKRDDKWQTMDATMLVPGDLVLLAAGAAVPADCIVNEGRIEVDQAALTGESLPVTMYKGDTPKMGSTGACMCMGMG